MDAPYKTLFHALPMGAVLLERRGGEEFVILDVNAMAAQAGGWGKLTPEESIGMNILEAFEGLRESGLLDYYHKTLDVGEAIILGDFPYADPEVPYGIFALDLVLLSLDHLLITYRNITQQKQTEHRLRGLLQAVPDLVILFDEEGRYQEVLTTQEHLLAYEPDTVLGKRITEVLPGELADHFMELLGHAFATGAMQHLEYELEVGVGLRWFEGRLVPVDEPSGGKRVALFVISDVTEQKKIEAERERLIDELETKNGELERFAYTVSHDLKTPLFTIKGFLGLMQQDLALGKNERVTADIKQINAAADTMQRLLDQLLELSRIGHLAEPFEAVALADVAREAVTLVAGRIAEHRVTVTIHPALPVVVGDRVRLLQVMQNLLDNAVKFMGDQVTPQVEIGYRRTDIETVVFVRDNGTGIAPQYQKKVFGLFERLNQQVEGTGIGLPLVKRIVEVHGGRVWVESKGQGHGTTFYFSLPHTEIPPDKAG